MSARILHQRHECDPKSIWCLSNCPRVVVSTAADNLALAADLAREAAEYRALTEQHAHTGRVFDYNQPLPPQPHYRPREWETQ